MKIRKFVGYVLAVMLVLISFSQHLWAKEWTITPSIAVSTLYDDNLDFDSKDEKDDFGANAVPSLTLDYASELLQFSLTSEVDVIKYFTETDFDRTNHRHGIDGQNILSPRWKMSWDFEYRRDQTIDSVLEETGQSFQRRRVETYDGGAGLFYQVTELSDIGFRTNYRKREYGSDNNTDFERYTFSLPYTKRFANERDIVRMGPSYSVFDSDGEEDGKDYRFQLEWERKISETLTSIVGAGGRYTDIEQDDGSSDTNWGYIGRMALLKVTDTFKGRIEATRDIRANANAEIVEVNRLVLSGDKQISERFGIRFYGSGYYTTTESTNTKDEKTTYFELRPSLVYYLTENHYLECQYQYQIKREHDEPGNPVTERNRAWLGVVLAFPKKWN